MLPFLFLCMDLDSKTSSQDSKAPQKYFVWHTLTIPAGKAGICDWNSNFLKHLYLWQKYLSMYPVLETINPYPEDIEMHTCKSGRIVFFYLFHSTYLLIKSWHNIHLDSSDISTFLPASARKARSKNSLNINIGQMGIGTPSHPIGHLLQQGQFLYFYPIFGDGMEPSKKFVFLNR